jgi:hypothetical protein
LWPKSDVRTETEKAADEAREWAFNSRTVKSTNPLEESYVRILHAKMFYKVWKWAGTERVLVTLLRNLGPHKNSFVLVGGLTLRYLVRDRPPVVPQHAGTLDIDVVIDLVILEDTEAYRTLEANLKKIGFERGENDRGQQESQIAGY